MTDLNMLLSCFREKMSAFVQFARIAARRIGKAKTNPLSRGKHNQFETRAPARQKSVAPDLAI